MTDDLTRRLEAVERAVTDGHTDLTSVADATDIATRLDAVERRLDEVETRLDETEAATQALRGYLGGVDGVSEAVERRADLALAKAEAVEDAVFEGDDGLAVERLPDADVPVRGADPAADAVDAPDATDATDPTDTPDPTDTTDAIHTPDPTDTIHTPDPTDTSDATDATDPTAADDHAPDAGLDAVRSRSGVSASAAPSPSGGRDRSPTVPSGDATDPGDRSFLTRLRDAL
jgi:hypothetical protein